MCRQIASVIVMAMAQSDVSFTVMAARIGRREKTVRRWVNLLMDGRCKRVGLSEVSDMMFACGGAILKIELVTRGGCFGLAPPLKP
jgi:hypothetical protein